MGDNNDTMSGRFRHGRQGPGNAVSRFLRGAVWALPGGREAFPEGGDGTIWWGRNASLGDHAGGNTVLGAAARGAIDPTGQLLPTGGGTGLRARGLGSAAARVSDAAAQRVNTGGSVVGRGFLTRSGMGPTASGPGQARTVEYRNALGFRLGQAPGLPQAGFRMAGTDGGPGGVPTPPTRAAGATTAAAPGRPSGGGGNRQRGASQLGMTQLGQASWELMMEGESRFRNRGGLMQEY